MPRSGPIFERETASTLTEVLDHRLVRPLWEWVSAGYRPFGIAILLAGLLWFAYGLYGSIAFTSEDVSVSWWFVWDLPAIPTIALAVIVGASMTPARGFVTDAVLVAAVIGGLLLGVALGSGPDGGVEERAFAVFATGTVVVGASAWLAGVAIGYVVRNRGRGRSSGITYVAIALVLALIIVSFVLPAIRPSLVDPPTAGSGPSTGRTTSVAVSIDDVRWDTEPHYYLPRLGALTVALEVGYRAHVGEVPYSRADWLAQDADGVAHEAMVWPNRRPLRKIGSALGSGVLAQGGPGMVGWIAFVVPEGTRWLDVIFEPVEGETLGWRVDGDGARLVTSTPEPPSGNEG